MKQSQSRALLPVVTIATLLLSACGQDPAPTAPAATPAPAAETAPAPAPVVQGEKPVSDDALAVIEANAADIKCNIETIDGQTFENVRPQVSADHALKVVGWYVPAAAGPVQLVLVNEDGSKHWKVALPTLAERPDVAAATGNPAALASGIAVDLDMTGMPTGFYGIYVSDAAHGAASICGIGRGFYIQ
jgi:hypothetical protein